MEFRKFRFGKYKGKEICGIAMTHTGYILWLLENTQFKLNEIEQECFDAVAKATKAEIENGAACGQLAIICE